jgi:hypothetical protein
MGSDRGCAILASLLALHAVRLGAQDASHDTVAPALPRPGAIEIFHNERGQVWDVIYPPGVSTGMHRHAADFVVVELVDTDLKVTSPDGKQQIRPIHRGQVAMLHEGLTHIEEGVIGRPQRNSILIELQDGGPQSYPNTTEAPNGFAADGANKVTDNARVILWSASWPQGEASRSFFQTHDMFLVPIDVGILSITSSDEPAKNLPVADGQVVFLTGGHIRAIQSLQGTIRAAVVELK